VTVSRDETGSTAINETIPALFLNKVSPPETFDGRNRRRRKVLAPHCALASRGTANGLAARRRGIPGNMIRTAAGGIANFG
jgi:hypothetical protein